MNCLLNQNRKCVFTGIELTFNLKTQTASLDRIDSSKDYVVGNVQWVHKTINNLKQDFSDEELIYWANLITNYKK